MLASQDAFNKDCTAIVNKFFDLENLALVMQKQKYATLSLCKVDSMTDDKEPKSYSNACVKEDWIDAMKDENDQSKSNVKFPVKIRKRKQRKMKVGGEDFVVEVRNKFGGKVNGSKDGARFCGFSRFPVFLAAPPRLWSYFPASLLQEI